MLFDHGPLPRDEIEAFARGMIAMANGREALEQVAHAGRCAKCQARLAEVSVKGIKLAAERAREELARLPAVDLPEPPL